MCRLRGLTGKAMSKYDSSKPQTGSAAYETSQNPEGTVNQLQDVIAGITQQLMSHERRHTEILHDMQQRLASLGAEAKIARVNVPEVYQSALSNIQSGLAQLSERVAEVGGEATSPSPGAGQQEASSSTSPAPLRFTETSHTPEQPAAGQTAHADTDADRLFDVVGGNDGDDAGQDWDGDPNSPWDANSAEALARIYEDDSRSSKEKTPHCALISEPTSATTDGADGYDQMQTAVDQDTSPENQETSDATKAAMTFSEQQQQASSAAASLSQSHNLAEKSWLEDRFAEIARRLEGQVGSTEADRALQELNERVSQLETRFTNAMENVATREDVGGLRIVEAHINEITQHLEETQGQLARVSEIEAQLGSVAQQLSDANFSQLLENGVQMAPEAIEDVAIAAAEKAAAQLSLMGQGQSHSEDRLAEMQQSLLNFMDEHRRGDVESHTMLETMQQAMIRVLDRVDAIEMGGQQAPEQTEEAQGLVAREPVMPEIEDATFGKSNVAPNVEPETPVHHAEDEAPSSSFNAETNAGPLVPPQGHSEEPASWQSESQTDNSPFDVVPGEDRAAQPNETSSEPPHALDPSTTDEEDDQTPEASPETAQDTLSGPSQPAASDPVAESVSSTHASIQKMRQELIANAQRAKLQAAAEAAKAMDEGKQKAAASNDKPGKSGGLFGLTKRKLTINIIIALCTLPAFAMMFDLPKSLKSFVQYPIIISDADVRPSDDATMIPAHAAMASQEDVMDPTLVQAGRDQQNPKAALAVKKVAGDDGSYESRIIDDPAEAELTAAALISKRPAGMTIYNPGNPPSIRELSRFEERADLAERSAKLGKYAAPATPASLEETEFPRKVEAESKKPIVRGNARKALSLPPAHIGPMSLRITAAKGNPSAQFQVATRLMEAKGAKRDLAEAADWFKRSANQGFAQSQYRLGTMHERGLGVLKDLARAKTWYLRAADQGNVKAMHNLAVLSANPANQSPDYNKAAHWFKKAADRGLADSQFNLAVLYENGLGVGQDIKRAYLFFSLASKGGDAEASRRRDAVVRQMSTEQVAAAEALVKGFKTKRPDRLANDARFAGQVWKTSQFGAQNFR